MRIAVVHNSACPDGAPDELDVLSQAEAVIKALQHQGHRPVRLACDLNLAETKNALRAIQPNLVFNLVESLDGSGGLIHLFPSLLDAMGLPYTGACTEAMFLTSNKLLAKTLLKGAGLPTPDWIATNGGCRPSFHQLPPENLFRRHWIIKSVWEHASIGLDAKAVVAPYALEDLEDLLKIRALDSMGPCFAEVFIDGREFNLSLLECQDGVSVLPPAEIRFENFDPDQPKIVGYNAKWETGSDEYRHTPRSFDFGAEDEDLLEELKHLALDCWRLFGLKGWARVDFRVDSQKRPWILEVNANPCLSPDAGFAAAVRRFPLTYTQAINRIVGCIISNSQRKPRTV
jgi:D-alanine-D-alanine ligase